MLQLRHLSCCLLKQRERKKSLPPTTFLMELSEVYNYTQSTWLTLSLQQKTNTSNFIFVALNCQLLLYLNSLLLTQPTFPCLCLLTLHSYLYLARCRPLDTLDVFMNESNSQILTSQLSQMVEPQTKLSSLPKVTQPGNSKTLQPVQWAFTSCILNVPSLDQRLHHPLQRSPPRERQIPRIGR